VGSIADGVTGNFYCHIPSERTMYLGSNLPLTELCTTNISWRPVPRADKIITFVYRLLKSESLGLLETAGPVQACSGFALLLSLHRASPGL